MTSKQNPFLVKSDDVCNRWNNLQTDHSLLSNTTTEQINPQINPQINDRFKPFNETDEYYEKKNIFHQTSKSDKPQHYTSPGFMVFTKHSPKEEKKPQLKIDEMSESVFNNEFPTLC